MCLSKSLTEVCIASVTGAGYRPITSTAIASKREDYVKSLWMRLLELLVLYAVVGAIAWFFENSIGNAFPQGWEFYAVTGCLFLVLAYPGYVLRYLRKHHA